ncbi:patatin-like phospholipase family protein [Nocardioides rubriscoriae]|uniref:patatin-like phospholipase family protein n=1 Tax=Nocardioides rubriscoriae TaxID=642762 RepID=UPI001479538E|nr:patatin-like phospholipase family protein [Nocardioides rubriscoriae]
MNRPRRGRPATPQGSTGRHIFVLSGGGSRGGAQVGMLRALMGAGIVPDVLVGASVGSLNAAFVSRAPTLDRVDELAGLWRGMSGRTLMGRRHVAALNVALRRPYLFQPTALRTLITTWVGDGRIEELPTLLRIATTDLSTGRAAHHDVGDLTDTILASAALPAVFPPVHLPGPDGPRLHVDAGVSANMPWAGAFEIARPGDTVWGLDVTRTAPLRVMHNPLDVLIASLVATVRRQEPPAAPAGVTVRHLHLDNDFDCGRVFDFSHTGTLFRLGEQAATAALVATAAAA